MAAVTGPVSVSGRMRFRFFTARAAAARMAACTSATGSSSASDALFAALETHLKLEWRYEEAPADQEVAGSMGVEAPAALVPPPPDELAALLEMATAGRLNRLRDRATQLEQEDPRYAPFAAKLRELARGMEKKQIIALIQHYQGASSDNT